MNPLSLLVELKRLDINIEVVEGQLKIDAPAGKLTAGLIEQLKSKKIEIIDFLQNNLQKKVKYESIEPSEKKEHYTLSAAQKRLYILQQMDVDITGYNLPQFLTLQGDVNIPGLMKTFEKLVSRHESLRTSFHMIDDKPVQAVHDQVEFKMENYQVEEERSSLLEGTRGLAPLPIESAENRRQKTEDRRQTPEGKPATHLSSVIRHLSSEFIRPFDLAAAPLLRVRLVKEENKKYVLMVDMHHIISDGTSQGILTKEFMSLYKGNELAPLRLQYKDYSYWQNSPKVRDDIRRQEEFWRREFDGEIPVLNLPYDYPRPAVQRFEGNTVDFELEEAETGRLKELALTRETTLFMVILAVFNIFLSKVSGQEDIVVGTPSAGRQHPDIEPIIGMFVNTLALRSYSRGTKKFTEYLEEIKQKTLKAFENQDYPFEELVEKVTIGRDLSRNPLFDVMFALQNISDPRGNEAKPTKQDLKITPGPVGERTSKFDLSLYVAERQKRLYLSLEYCTRLFKDETPAGFIKYIKAIILSVIEDPGKKISGIEIISAEEKNRILFKFNDTAADYPRGKTIHELFARQVEQTPDNIAVVGPMQMKYRTYRTYMTYISYRELCERSDGLAYTLIEKGVQPGAIVGIKVERSLEMIIGIFGILKAGGAYMPIDPEFPGERIRYILADSNAKMLLTPDAINRVPTPGNLHPAPCALHPANTLAYVLYTSGSTGKPKGVMVQHGSVVNVLSALFKMYPFLETDVYLLKTSFLFDVSVSELFGWYWGGGRLAILGKDDHKDPWKILDGVESSMVTHINFVPSMFNAFLNALDERNISKLSKLKYIFLAGEALLPGLVEKFRRLDTGIILENIYGPTEGTVYSSSYSLSKWQGGESIPIGAPIQNIKLYITGKNNRLQPVGIPGELCIAGIGVARGYLNNPELTAQKFDHDGYNRSYRSNRSYRTGDLARWLPDGDIEFLGRTDLQVKIRGFRVEPGEIENLLSAVNELKEAVVITREREDKDKYLCAYIVPAVSGKRPDIDRLKEYLAEKMPRYMVPDYFVILDQIPLTASGKIDRKALPVSELKEEDGLIPPRDKTGKKLVEIWSEVLGIKREIIGINSNFFKLGGHSLRATLLVSKIYKEFNIKMTIAEVFARPGLKDLAGYISRAERRIFEAILPVEKREYFPQSSAQKRLFLLDQFEDIGTGYHTPSVFKVEGKIDKEKYESAVKALIRRHETLRTSFELKDNEPIQRVHREVDFKIEEVPFRGKDIKEIIKNFVRPFDLSGVPLLRMGLVFLSKEEYLFLFDMHHIIGDGTSMGLMIDEFGRLWQGEELAPLRIQYRDFSSWQNHLFETGKIKLQEEYWCQLYCDAPDLPKLDLPTDYPRPVLFSYKGDSFYFKSDIEDSVRFKEIGDRVGVTPFMNLLALFNLVLFKYTGQEDIIVGCDIAGRPHVDLQHVIGMFVNELAMRNHPHGEKSFIQFLREVKENSIKAFQNQDYQFEELVDRLNIDRDTSRNPLFDVEFAFQNFESSAIELKDVSFTPVEFENKTANFDIALDAMERGDQIYLRFQYCTSLFKKRTIEAMAGHLLNAMKAVTRDPGTLLADISILSEKDKQQILCEFNDTNKDFAKDKSYPQLFEIQAVKTPDRIAAIYKDEFLSYGQLAEASGQLALYLYQEKNVRVEDRVGVLLDRSNYFLTAVIGIMKAGAAYIPIEPFMPGERVKTIIDDAKINVLVSQVKYQKNLRQFQEECKELHTILCLDNDNKQPPIKSFCGGVQGGQFFQKAPPLVAEGNAYVIYTSGTTGKPKGVMIHHRGMINHLYAKINDLSITGEDIIAQTAPAGFDISVWQFLAALLPGGATLIIDKEIVLEPGEFLQVLQKGRVTILESVPSLMNAFLEIISSKQDRKLKYLRWMVPTGEALTTALVRKWYDVYPGIKLVNAYGPTEAADDVTHYAVNNAPPETQPGIPIGKPLQNLHVYILDKYLALCPVGVRGEICVSGVGVGKGYLNNPELTFEKFCLRRPGGTLFEKTVPPGPPCKNFSLKGTPVEVNHRSYRSYKSYVLYRTGDIGYFREDGNIECLGRMDQQVKIRGNRIELGDIETQISKYNDINETVVIAKQDEKGNKNLYSYFVSNKTIDITRLRGYLQEVLPDYMIPAYFVQLDKIPITPNGKLDRKKLPDPGPTGTGERYVPPGNKIEEKLVAIWSEVLGIKKNTISIDDDFFRLGGHSLKAAILTAKIHKELNVKLPIAEIFRTPTIREIAKCSREAAGERFTPIEPVGAKDYYPLSSVQKRLYVLQQMVPDNMSYNLPRVLWLEGDIDIEKLNEAFTRLINRHESLRTSFIMVGNEPVQRVHEEVEFKMEYFHFAAGWHTRHHPETNKNLHKRFAQHRGSARRAVSSFIRSFDLSRAPLLRVGAIKTGESQYILVFDLHHIITDGLSQVLLKKEFVSLYAGKVLSPLRLQYKDYSAWQNSERNKEEFKRQEAFWLKELDGEIPVLKMPTDYLRPTVQSFAGSHMVFHLSKEETHSLNELARSQGATLFMILLAVYHIFLSKISNQEDIVVGAPVAGRSHADLEPIIGMFVNTLALRNHPSGEKSFTGFLGEVKEKTLGAFENQDYPFEDLVEKVVVERDMSRNPVFDVTFILQNIFDKPGEESKEKNSNISIKPYVYENKTSKFDLTLIAAEKGEELDFLFEYCTKLFRKETLIRFIQYFKEIISFIVKDRGKKIWEIEIIPLEEKTRLLIDFNRTGSDYPKNKTLHGLFEEQVEQTPDHIAVVGNHQGYQEGLVTYREFNNKSHQLAQLLKQKGAAPDTIVGIIMERSVEMIVGILGILKTGGAYLPIKLDYPGKRIKYMLADSRANILVTTRDLMEDKKTGKWKNGRNLEIVFLDSFESTNFTPSTIPPFYPSRSSDMAYVIYTSGTTGKPKGVMTTHANVIRVVRDTNYIQLTGRDRVLQLSNYAFDGSVFDIYGALLNGAALILIQREKVLAVDQLGALIKQEQVTVFFVTTALFNTLVDLHIDSFNNIRKVLFGGERVSLEHSKRAMEYVGKGRIIHVYGPTETTVYATYYPIYRIEETPVTIPIGKPISNTLVYILDKNLNPVPIGINGEVYIGGEGTARGYLNHPGLTAEKFIKNPFVKEDILYRTGDLARRLPDENANIEFIGRIDSQVKIRGLRIELGEIESRLIEHQLVKETVVEARGDEKGNKYLYAYIVPQSKVQGAGYEWDNQLRQYLSQILPNFMVPSFFIPIESIPLTSNGKIDRKALPEPEINRKENYAAPRDEIEEKIAEMWVDILGIGKEKISINSNFFKIGGHSLNAVKFTAMMKNEFAVEIPITFLYEKPSIKDISSFIKANEYEEEPVSILNPGVTAQKNLFCFPPGGAYGLGYREFASIIKNFSVYRCSFIEEEGRLEKYTQIITNIQPVGPYLMFGYSAAGKLVFQVTKAFENYGLEVSDIILVDSFFEKENDKEQIIEDTQSLINNIQKRMENSGVGFLKEKVKEKIQKYLMYNLSITNLERIHANVHLVLSRQTPGVNPEKLHCWDKLTTKPVKFYQGFGNHEAMFHPGPVEKNTTVIQEILDNITKNVTGQAPHRW